MYIIWFPLYNVIMTLFIVNSKTSHQLRLLGQALEPQSNLTNTVLPRGPVRNANRVFLPRRSEPVLVYPLARKPCGGSYVKGGGLPLVDQYSL